jgi:hypothetical protein
VSKPSDRNAAYQALLLQLELAEDCRDALAGFLDTANSSLYYQQPIPDSIKGQLLGALVNAVPVMESASTAEPLMELLSKPQGTRVRSTAEVPALDDLVSTKEVITYESLLPLVNGVLRPLDRALKRFRSRNRLPAESSRHVLTIRLPDPAPTDDTREAHRQP